MLHKRDQGTSFPQVFPSHLSWRIWSESQLPTHGNLPTKLTSKCLWASPAGSKRICTVPSDKRICKPLRKGIPAPNRIEPDLHCGRPSTFLRGALLPPSLSAVPSLDGMIRTQSHRPLWVLKGLGSKNYDHWDCRNPWGKTTLGSKSYHQARLVSATESLVWEDARSNE